MLEFWPSSAGVIWCRPSGCRHPASELTASGRAGGHHLIRHRTALKCRIHAVLMNLGHPCPVSDLFGVSGRQLLDALDLPEPWSSTVQACLAVIDELNVQIAVCDAEIRRCGAAHPHVPLLRTAPGIGWTLAYTIASEIGDIERFSSPKKLCGYTGLEPRVQQSGARDRRGALAKNGPRHLRWALIEAAVMAARHPVYRDHYMNTKARVGKHRGTAVARIEVARRLTEAIWYMLTRHQAFSPADPSAVLAA